MRLYLACPIGQQRNTETLTPDKEVSLARHSISPFRFTCKTTWNTPGTCVPSVGSSGSLSKPLEAIGIEPMTPCLQSRRSPAELRPLTGTTSTVSDQTSFQTGPPYQRYVWAREDLNLRPHAYQACALTN